MGIRGNVVSRGFRFFRRPASILISLVLAGALAGCGRGEPRDSLLSLLLSIDLIRGEQAASLLARVTPAPILDRRRIHAAGKILDTDFYWPRTQGRRPGLLLIHGMIDTGKDDPRVVWLATLLARAGFVVMVPDFPGMQNFQVGPQEVAEIIGAFQYLGTLGRQVEVDHRGMFSFSYGVGPTLIAAADPRIRKKVEFVVSFGGYYNLADVVAYLISGAYPGAKAAVQRKPPAAAKWLFVLHNLSLLGSPADRAILEKIARLKIRNERAPVAGLAAQLGGEGKLVYRLLTRKDPQSVLRLLSRMPPRLKGYLDEFSPKRVVSRVGATLIIAHGKSDSMIPYEESVKLARAFARRGRVHWAIFQLYGHTEPLGAKGEGVSPLLYLTEFRHFYSLVHILLGQ